MIWLCLRINRLVIIQNQNLLSLVFRFNHIESKHQSQPTPMPSPPYPPQLYPQSQSQLHQILTDYYSLTLQVQTLQRHILKIQTQNEQQYKIFNDQVEKLKLYIDQCQNQIKKRQERQLLLIDRLKELENSRFEEAEEFRFQGRNDKKLNDSVKSSELYEDFSQAKIVLKEKEASWNKERVTLIKDNQALMMSNLDLGQQVARTKNSLEQSQKASKALSLQLKKTLLQAASHQSQLILIKQALKTAQETISTLKAENTTLKIEIDDTQRLLTQKEKILPISSSCPNCLRLSKIHETEIQKKSRQVNGLRKDVECLLAFFQMGQQ